MTASLRCFPLDESVHSRRTGLSYCGILPPAAETSLKPTLARFSAAQPPLAGCSRQEARRLGLRGLSPWAGWADTARAMSQETVDRIRRGYEVLNREGVDAALDLGFVAPNVEVQESE